METKGGVRAGKAVLGTKKWSTWPQDGSPYRAQIDEKSMPKSIKKRCLSRSIFGTILADLLMENGSNLAPKRDQKSIFS